MAIEDAAVIARCLEQCSNVPDALQLFQRNRIERTSKIVVGSTESRGLYRIEDVGAMKRAFADQDLTKSRAQWLYSYDPLNVALV